MMRALLLLAILWPGAAPGQDWLRDRPAPKAGHAYPDTYCTNRGVRVELGETSCIRTNCCPHRGCDVFTARCGMSTNVPVWRRESEGCGPEISRASDPAPPASAPPAPG